MPNASSCMLFLPRMIAPAAMSLATTGACALGRKSLSARVPAVFGKPATDVVLYHDRNAVQRPLELPLGSVGVRCTRGPDRGLAVVGNEGAEVLFVLDLVGERLHQVLALQIPGADPLRGLGGGQFGEVLLSTDTERSGKRGRGEDREDLC